MWAHQFSLSINDVDHYAEALPEDGHVVRQLSSGSMNATFNSNQTHRTHFNLHKTQNDIAYFGPTPEHSLWLIFNTGNHAVSANGESCDLKPSLLGLHGYEYNTVISAQSQAAIIGMSLSELAKKVSPNVNITNDLNYSMIRKAVSLMDQSEGVRRIENMVSDELNLLEKLHIEDGLYDQVAFALEAVAVQRTVYRETPFQRRKIAWKAMDFIHESPFQTTPGDVATCLGFNKRTLEIAFREITQLTLSQYIQIERLHRVQRYIRLNKFTGSETVSDIFSRFGITSPGRFSGQYAKLFGRYPLNDMKQLNIRKPNF